MKTQSKHLFLLGLLAFVAIIATGCPHKNEPIPEPTPATPTITMKSGSDIQKLLISGYLKANSEATSFKASKTPAPAGVTTANTLLSADGSETACVAWLDTTSKTIFYYAKGYTDAGKKIPLTDCSSMFRNCTTLETIDVSGFDTSAVKSFSQMFWSCTALTDIVGLDTLNTTSATSFFRMFTSCNSMTAIDISSFDASKITDTASMFSGCNALTTIYAKAGTDWSSITTITSSADMFANCTNLKGGAGTQWINNTITYDKSRARIDGGTSAPGYFTEK